MKLPILGVTLDPAVLPAADSESPGVLVDPFRLVGVPGWEIINQQDTLGANPVTTGLTTNTLYLIPRKMTGRLLQRMAAECVANTSGTAMLVVYASDSTGQPGALIWESGSVTLAAATPIEVAFSAGTFNDPDYSSSGLFLRAKYVGERVWFGILMGDVTGVTLRGYGHATMRAIEHRGPASASITPARNAYTQAVGSFTPPDPAVAAAATITMPAIWIRNQN